LAVAVRELTAETRKSAKTMKRLTIAVVVMTAALVIVGVVTLVVALT
jgi:hypothetical protein